jgi:hypothetical protein
MFRARAAERELDRARLADLGWQSGRGLLSESRLTMHASDSHSALQGLSRDLLFIAAFSAHNSTSRVPRTRDSSLGCFVLKPTPSL